MSKTAPKIIERLLVMEVSLFSVSNVNLCGLLIFSRRENHLSPRVKPLRKLLAGSSFFRNLAGSQRFQLNSRLIAIRSIVPPKMVLTPGIETGIKKTTVSRAINNNIPSRPSRFLISKRVRLSSGRFLTIISSFSQSELFSLLVLEVFIVYKVALFELDGNYAYVKSYYYFGEIKTLN